MRHLLTVTALALGLSFSSCDNNRNSDSAALPATIDMERNIGAESSGPLQVSDLAYTQLSGDSAVAFFKRARIIDVVGDTAVLLDENPAESRLIMFDISDGRYLGQISHRGSGPGEYRVILGAFVDGADGSVLLPDFDRPVVNVYSLATDSLLGIIDREPVMSPIEPTGGVESCINVAKPSPEGLDIIQYDGRYNRIDSISIPGFRGGNFTTVWCNAGTQGVFMPCDTLYALQPGDMMPLAVLKSGKYAMTPQAEEEVMMKIMTTGADEIELLKPYILVRDIQTGGGKMLLTTMYDGVKHSDIYSLADGSLLYRNAYDTLDKPSRIVVTDGNGRTVNVERVMVKGDKWYGIVSEEDAASSGGTSPENTNCAFVSFTL